MSVLPAPPNYADTRQTPLEARGQVGCNHVRNATKMEENAVVRSKGEVNVKGLLIELLPRATKYMIAILGRCRHL